MSEKRENTDHSFLNSKDVHFPTIKYKVNDGFFAGI